MEIAHATDEHFVFEKLAEAAKLYERYLEIAKIGQLPFTGADDEPAPPRTDLPLTLVITSGS